MNLMGMVKSSTWNIQSLVCTWSEYKVLLERTVQQHIGAHVMELVMCIPRGVILQTACANAVQTEPPALDFEDARLSVTGVIYPHKLYVSSNSISSKLRLLTQPVACLYISYCKELTPSIPHRSGGIKIKSVFYLSKQSVNGQSGLWGSLVGSQVSGASVRLCMCDGQYVFVFQVKDWA